MLFAVAAPAVSALGIAACSGSSSAGDDSSISNDGGAEKDSTVIDGGPKTPVEAGVDAGPKKYCATDLLIIDAGPDADAIAPASPQTFDSKMAGCPGVVAFEGRATLCAASCQPCSVVDWVTHNGGAAPAYDYWTNDNLGWTGDFARGFACSASPFPADAAAPGPGTCGATLPDGGATLAPMRVCIDNNENPYMQPSTDSLGNLCNWNKCAFETDQTLPTIVDAGPDAALLVFDHMGGCEDNPTAGTLCCCE